MPAALIRAHVGDELAITVKNRLAGPTSVHWHGIALRNDMDGAFPATPHIAANSDFTYRINQVVRGWMNYYGHFYRTEISPRCDASIPTWCDGRDGDSSGSGRSNGPSDGGTTWCNVNEVCSPTGRG